MTKVELIHCGLGGPYTIKLNGTEIDNVEDIQLENDGGLHRAYITLLVDNYAVKRVDKEPKTGRCTYNDERCSNCGDIIW